MKNTFVKSVAIPVEFTMTDELETDVVCATEVYVEKLIEEHAVCNQFHGKLQNLAKKISVSVTPSKLKLTFAFDNIAKEYPEEVESQIKFIVYSVLRPHLHLRNIPYIESVMTCENSI